MQEKTPEQQDALGQALDYLDALLEIEFKPIKPEHSDTPEAEEASDTEETSDWSHVRISLQINKRMITQTKEQYISPECEMLLVKSEGVICASLDPTYNNPFNPEKSW